MYGLDRFVEQRPLLADRAPGRRCWPTMRRLGLSLREHPLALIRTACVSVVCCRPRGRRAGAGRDRACGRLVLIRQRPGNRRAIFVTLEDENLLIWADTAERQRRVLGAQLLGVVAEINVPSVQHLLCRRLEDRGRWPAGRTGRCVAGFSLISNVTASRRCITS